LTKRPAWEMASGNPLSIWSSFVSAKDNDIQLVA
jgi:hypothetical protein